MAPVASLYRFNLMKAAEYTSDCALLSVHFFVVLWFVFGIFLGLHFRTLKYSNIWRFEIIWILWRKMASRRMTLVSCLNTCSSHSIKQRDSCKCASKPFFLHFLLPPNTCKHLVSNSNQLVALEQENPFQTLPSLLFCPKYSGAPISSGLIGAFLVLPMLEAFIQY